MAAVQSLLSSHDKQCSLKGSVKPTSTNFTENKAPNTISTKVYWIAAAD